MCRKENIFIKVNQSIKNYSKQSVLVKDGIEKIIYSKDIKVNDVIFPDKETKENFLNFLNYIYCDLYMN